ncbi:MAG TPA: LON peptidase substrate-binding domain-containing protein, partial [Isosphaeraceae bacterium]
MPDGYEGEGQDVDDDLDLSGVKALRLFPLPGVVLFPHAVLPLHIFEERYKAMTEDALASDRLVTVVMLRPEAEWKGKGSPRYEEYGCVGRILKYERLEDGKFNFLLLGLRRVRLTREVPSGSMYRASEFEAIEDLAIDGEELEAQEAELIRLFRGFLEPHGGIDPHLEEILSSPLPAGALADILSHALPIPVEMKQGLLAER